MLKKKTETAGHRVGWRFVQRRLLRCPPRWWWGVGTQPRKKRNNRRGGRRGRATTEKARQVADNAAPQNGAPAPHASTRNGGQTPPTAAQPAAGPSAGQSAVAPPTALPRRQVVPAAAPQQRQAPLPAATQRVADQSARAFPAPPARAADQPPAAAPDLTSPKDFPEPRWRRPTAPRHTVGAQQDGGQMETNARHVVGGTAANEARVERMLSCMETMMQQMTELLAVVQKVASAIQPCSHHA
ncbi:translation initiation factor IF-2-like [Schistocerca serialis cubense]|uniref:translation initiation factor IF-2-like n=1 Tax=Schistocerca serialis cubense TaxID=2023355 RepID=UPI00214E1728|nr:translation initiation factor IF-2-like [Schistocerca serialis cubense]